MISVVPPHPNENQSFFLVQPKLSSFPGPFLFEHPLKEAKQEKWRFTELLGE